MEFGAFDGQLEVQRPINNRLSPRTNRLTETGN